MHVLNRLGHSGYCAQKSWSVRTAIGLVMPHGFATSDRWRVGLEKPGTETDTF